MSSFEDYGQTAGSYDGTRGPTGAEIIVGCLAQGLRPLAEMHVLDAGCGTGNYARALIGQVARIDAVDLAPAMLERARAKLGAELAAGRIAFWQASIEALPFADETFDGAMVNQVLHHLPDRPDEGFPARRKVLAELARVLKPGGVLTINTCSPEQLRAGYWFFALIPEAAARVARRFGALDALEAELRAAGLEPRGRFVPVDAVLQGPAYFDARGPLGQAWRAGDSTWALARAEELMRAKALVRQLEQQGELEAFRDRHDARRPEIGQITILYATKRARP